VTGALQAGTLGTRWFDSIAGIGLAERPHARTVADSIVLTDRRLR